MMSFVMTSSNLEANIVAVERVKEYAELKTEVKIISVGVPSDLI